MPRNITVEILEMTASPEDSFTGLVLGTGHGFVAPRIVQSRYPVERVTKTHTYKLHLLGFGREERLVGLHQAIAWAREFNPNLFRPEPIDCFRVGRQHRQEILKSAIIFPHLPVVEEVPGDPGLLYLNRFGQGTRMLVTWHDLVLSHSYRWAFRYQEPKE